MSSYPTYGARVHHRTIDQSRGSWETSSKEKKLNTSYAQYHQTPHPSPLPTISRPEASPRNPQLNLLLRPPPPRNGPSVNPTHICYFHPNVPADSASKPYWTPYWGTKESTRLFLVNRQISNEALELFYSTYPFHFPQSVDVALVNATLRDTLSSWD